MVHPQTHEDPAERIRLVCVKFWNARPKTPSTAALALSVALLVLGVVAIGLMVGSAGNGFFQHYADVLTRLSHGL